MRKLGWLVIAACACKGGARPGDVRLAAWPSAMEGGPVWSPVGPSVAWVERAGVRRQVVVNGHASLSFPGIDARSLRFDAAGVPTYVIDNGHGHAVVVGQRVGPTFDDASELPVPVEDVSGAPVRDPSGRHVAFVVRTGERWQVVVDGVGGPIVDRAWAPSWSADGRSVGYGAKVGDALWWKVQPVAR